MFKFGKILNKDPLLWIGLYLFSAFLCFWTFLNVTKILPKPSIPLAVPLVWAVIILFVAFYVYKSVPYSPGNLWEFLEMEEGREMGGLSIILFEVGLIIVTLQETSSKPTFWSWISRGYYFSAFSIVSLSFYILLFLQPQLNEKLRVEHCSGILY